MARYTITRKLLAVGRDYVVEDAEGRVCFQVDGKVRFATTFVLESAEGTPLLRCREKLMTIDPTIIVTRGDAEAARVRRTSTGDVPHVFEIETAGGAPMQARGSFLRGASFELEREGRRIGTLAFVHGQIVDEAFHLDLAAGLDDALVVAVAMCLVAMDTHRGELHSAT